MVKIGFLFFSELVFVFLNELALQNLLDNVSGFEFYFNFQSIFLSALIAFMITSLIFAASNRLLFSFILSTLLLSLISAIHYFKVVYLGLPLFFADYEIIVEAYRSLGWLISSPLLYPGIFLALTGLAFLCWQIARRDKEQMPRVMRFSLAAVSLVTVVTIFSFRTLEFDELFPKFRFANSQVMKKGLYPFLAMSIRHAGGPPEPADYSEARIAEIIKKYPSPEITPDEARVTGANPDIIFYVMESLMDYEGLGIRYQEDPMPFFNSLKSVSGSSHFFSPAYGGDTIKPEFELLTGLSLFPQNNPNPMAFINHDAARFPSLCDAFRELGYRCVGINAVRSDNFRRDVAYQRMGFDAFFGLASKFNDEDIKHVGKFRIPDSLIVDEFMKEVGDKPTFAYLMTNSTHAEYEGWNLRPKFKVLNEGLSEASKIKLQRYATAINQADQALKGLVEGLEKKGRQAIVITYGDHFPGLGEVFSDLKVSEAKDWETFRKYQTPLRVWSNCGKPSKGDVLVSPNLFIGYLIDFLPRKPNFPLQFRLALKMFETWNVVSSVLVDKTASVTVRDLAKPEDDELLRDYNLVQYDLLYGQKYTVKLMPHYAANAEPR